MKPRDWLEQNTQKVVRRLRIKAGMSQEELAAKLGYTESYICLIENGNRRLHLQEFVEIVRALDLDLVEVVEKLFTKSSAGRKSLRWRKRRR